MIRQTEINQSLAALLSNQSMLILGDEGSGKTSIAEAVTADLQTKGYLVAIATYSGSAKRTFTEIAEQLGVDTMKQAASGKFVAMTADELRDAIAPVLTQTQTCNSNGQCNSIVLICDDAHRFPSSFRYWLEDLVSKGAVMLLLATKPPRKDIFLKLPRIALQPLQTEEVRSLMLAEAKNLGVSLDSNKLASLQERSGGNPYLAQRVVREEMLGVSEGEAGDHVEYIDGTPFLIAAISLVAIVRFVGLGLQDKSLYIIGGIATVLAITLRVVLMRANSRQSSRL